MIAYADDNIRFVRATDPLVAVFLQPWLIETDGLNRVQLGALLYERMTRHPEDTFVLLIYVGQELRGFGVAYCRERDVMVWQAGTTHLSREIVDNGLECIKAWARSKGFSRLSTQPSRNFRIWKRRWGFEPANENDVVMEI